MKTSPYSALMKPFKWLLLISHPYRNEVLGSIADLHAIQRDDLYQHYQTYYNPANAIVAIAGDFDTVKMLELVKLNYGAIPGHPVPQIIVQKDAPLPQEKHVEVKGPGETTYLELSWRAPAATEKDFFAMTVLDSFLPDHPA